MDLEDIFSQGENLSDILPDNKDIIVLEKIYGEEYLLGLRDYIHLRVSDYLYEGKITSMTTEGFNQLTDYLFNLGAGTLKRILDNSLKTKGYNSYGPFIRALEFQEVPDPTYHVCLLDSDEEDLYEELDPDELNIILGLRFQESE